MDIIIEGAQITNPMSEEAVLATDSDAELSVFQRELIIIAAALNTADGRPSVLFRIVQLFVVLMAGYMIVFGQTVMDAQYHTCYERGVCPRPYGPNSLASIQYTCLGLSVLSLLLVLDSVRCACSGAGPLDDLGAGTVRISARDARNLDRWRRVLGVLATLACVGGLMLVGSSVSSFFFGAGWYRSELRPRDVAILAMPLADQALEYLRVMPCPGANAQS